MSNKKKKKENAEMTAWERVATNAEMGKNWTQNCLLPVELNQWGIGLSPPGQVSPNVP